MQLRSRGLRLSLALTVSVLRLIPVHGKIVIVVALITPTYTYSRSREVRSYVLCSMFCVLSAGRSKDVEPTDESV